MKALLFVGLCLLASSRAIVSTQAGTIPVTNTKDSGDGSLRQAISDATAGATIVFNIPTSDRGYDPDTGIYTIALSTAQLTIDKDLTISGPGAKSLNIVRSANPGTPEFTVLSIAANRFVSVTGLAISNGSGNAGGGVYADQNSSLLLDNVVVSGNAAVSGGGVYCKGGLLNIRNSNISNNSVNAGVGAGIAMVTYIENNHSFGGTLHISNSTISGNTLFGAGEGAGIFANEATITIDNTTISGNSEPFEQGNDFNGAGAGLYLFNGAHATITNSTITGNTIDRSGAGGAGIYADEDPSGKSLTLKNSIVDLNSHQGQGDDIAYGVTSQGFNIIGVVTGGQIVSQQPTDQMGVTAEQLNLGPLQDNGGPGPTHALQGSSVALDRGNSGGVTTDERGFARPVDSKKLPNPDGGDGSDIGAYEVQADQLFGCNDLDSVVHNNDDSGSGSLRDTIATVCAGVTITFASDVRGAIDLTTGELVLDKSLDIKGPGANLLAVRRSSAGGTPNFRIFNITGSYHVAISGLTIANGNTPSAFDFGGGIYNQGGALDLTSDTISGNTAGFGGGGIDNAGTMNVRNCTISGNSAGYSGGIAGNGLTTIINSTISGNVATHNAGGFSVAPGMSVTNCTITDNSAGESGGGIFNNGGNGASLTARNTIIALNAAASGPDISGAVISHGFNIVGDDSDATIPPADGSDQIGVTADDLQLGPLRNNGGSTFTHALLPGSVAIDAGNSSGASTDQRGRSRPVDLAGIDNVAKGDGSDIGAFELARTSPTPTPTPKPTATPKPTPKATPTPPSQLQNISTRKQVGSGQNVLIGGFIIVGTENKKVLLRGLGPSLPITGRLADPVLELHRSDTTLLAANDNWRDKQAAEITATGIPPSNNFESAIVTSLAAKPAAEHGAGYSAVLAGKGGTAGIGLLEIYDLNSAAKSKLANISTRGFVGKDPDLLIGGFIPGPSGRTPTKVLVRALGPSLTAQGVKGALQNPVLELHDANGTRLTNDNWKDASNAAEIKAVLPPPDERESAIITTLPASKAGYTAVVRGAGGLTGVALVEVYALN